MVAVQGRLIKKKFKSSAEAVFKLKQKKKRGGG